MPFCFGIARSVALRRLALHYFRLRLALLHLALHCVGRPFSFALTLSCRMLGPFQWKPFTELVLLLLALLSLLLLLALQSLI